MRRKPISELHKRLKSAGLTMRTLSGSYVAFSKVSRGTTGRPPKVLFTVNRDDLFDEDGNRFEWDL